MQRQRIHKLFIGASAFLVMGVAHAVKPLWTFEPFADYPPKTTVNAKGSVAIKYTVTNESTKNHLLRMLPIQGVPPL